MADLDSTAQKLLNKDPNNPNSPKKGADPPARPGLGLSRSTMTSSKPSLREAMLAQKKALAAKNLPARPGSAWHTFRPFGRRRQQRATIATRLRPQSHPERDHVPNRLPLSTPEVCQWLLCDRREGGRRWRLDQPLLGLIQSGINPLRLRSTAPRLSGPSTPRRSPKTRHQRGLRRAQDQVMLHMPANRVSRLQRCARRCAHRCPKSHRPRTARANSANRMQRFHHPVPQRQTKTSRLLYRKCQASELRHRKPGRRECPLSPSRH